MIFVTKLEAVPTLQPVDSIKNLIGLGHLILGAIIRRPYAIDPAFLERGDSCDKGVVGDSIQTDLTSS